MNKRRPHSDQRSRDKRSHQRRKSRFTFKLSEHFSKKDFMAVDENGKDRVRISLGLIGGLELLRSYAKSRVNIVKGYITQEQAEKEGFLKRNYHPLGLAADITVNDMDPKDVFLLAERIPEFKGIGLDLVEGNVHVDTRKEEERVMWVVDQDGRVDLTDKNRSQYFPASDT